MPEIEMQSVTSSNVESVGYDPEKKELRIKFKSGGTYSYAEVPKTVYESLMASDSKGAFVASAIRGRFKHGKV